MKRYTKYIKARQDALNLVFEKPKSLYTPSTFHILRVELKKLDAFFELLNFCSKGFKRNKTFAPFKLIFRQAGKVRELQIEEALLKKHLHHTTLQKYKDNLKQRRLIERRIFFSLINKTFLSGVTSTFHDIKPALQKVNKEKAEAYLENKSMQIRKLISQGNIQATQIHELRKQLKKIHYTEKILEKSNRNKSLAKKDILPKLMGKWHDCQIMIEHLKKAMDADGIGSREFHQIEKIRTQFASDREALYNKICLAIPQLDFF